MRKIKFTNNQYYHIFNRGVEKRIIFLDEEDFARFFYYLIEFNNKNLVANAPFRYRKAEIDVSGGLAACASKDKLAEILCFSLMPNHFHLLLKQIQDGGISLFLHRLSSAYTGYFNKKYDRVGALFQGTFKANLVNQQNYLNQLFYYILANPIELIEPRWKEKGLKNYKQAQKFLLSHKWSSYREFVSKKTVPLTLTDKDAILEVFGDLKNLKQFVGELIKENLNINSEFKKLIFE